jgi:hypothetical protein
MVTDQLPIKVLKIPVSSMDFDLHRTFVLHINFFQSFSLISRFNPAFYLFLFFLLILTILLSFILLLFCDINWLPSNNSQSNKTSSVNPKYTFFLIFGLVFDLCCDSKVCHKTLVFDLSVD